MNDSVTKIDNYVAALPEWQRLHLTTFRELVHEAEPAIEEDWKWNTPVFLLNGKMIFAMSAFKAHTKCNFILNGAALDDADHLFNNGFDAKNSRSIDQREGEKVDLNQLRSLVRLSIKLALR